MMSHRSDSSGYVTGSSNQTTTSPCTPYSSAPPSTTKAKIDQNTPETNTFVTSAPVEEKTKVLSKVFGVLKRIKSPNNDSKASSATTTSDSSTTADESSQNQNNDIQNISIERAGVKTRSLEVFTDKTCTEVEKEYDPKEFKYKPFMFEFDTLKNGNYLCRTGDCKESKLKKSKQNGMKLQTFHSHSERVHSIKLNLQKKFAYVMSKEEKEDDDKFAIICRYCGQDFARPQILREHVKKYHQVQRPTQPQSPPQLQQPPTATTTTTKHSHQTSTTTAIRMETEQCEDNLPPLDETCQGEDEETPSLGFLTSSEFSLEDNYFLENISQPEMEDILLISEAIRNPVSPVVSLLSTNSESPVYNSVWLSSTVCDESPPPPASITGDSDTNMTACECDNEETLPNYFM